MSYQQSRLASSPVVNHLACLRTTGAREVHWLQFFKALHDALSIRLERVRHQHGSPVSVLDNLLQRIQLGVVQLLGVTLWRVDGTVGNLQTLERSTGLGEHLYVRATV